MYIYSKLVVHIIIANKLYDFLQSQKLIYFYHANSISTWMSMLSYGKIISRQEMERLNLWKTYQKSDVKDKKYGVYDDVFLDIYDMHKLFKRSNYYGPLLSVISIDIILKYDFNIQITKTNPQDWIICAEYYNDIDEYIQDFLYDRYYERQKMMITLKGPRNCISINDIEYFILDNPQYSQIDLYKDGVKNIKSICDNIDINKRICRDCCKCHYPDNDIERLKYMFFTKDQILNKEHKEY